MRQQVRELRQKNGPVKKIEDLHELGAFMNCRAENEVQALLRRLNVITAKIDDLADLLRWQASSRKGDLALNGQM